VIEEVDRLDVYGTTFAVFHPAAWEEVKAMGKTRQSGWVFDLRPIVKEMGLEKVIEQIGQKEVIEQIGKKRVIEQIGKKQLIEQIGKKQLIEELGIDAILANLSPAQRRELQRRLSAESGGKEK
jgi:hypothetical protein